MKLSFLMFLFIATKVSASEEGTLTPLSTSPTKFGGAGSAFKPYGGSLDGSSVSIDSCPSNIWYPDEGYKEAIRQFSAYANRKDHLFLRALKNLTEFGNKTAEYGPDIIYGNDTFAGLMSIDQSLLTHEFLESLMIEYGPLGVERGDYEGEEYDFKQFVIFKNIEKVLAGKELRYYHSLPVRVVR